MTKFAPIIGLEIHVQPKTKSKMFCNCSAEYYGKEPNTHVCPVCLGLPGALPVPNKAAIEKCIKIALALSCEINEETKFDRKNYFYPDLPKAYQISQYDQPIGVGGHLDLDLGEGNIKRIRITRVHMEEDTGKSLHEGKQTQLDFNKSGLPLIEIVTEPDFNTKEEIDAFAKRLRQIIRYTEVSDADMEKGQMRYELNMSLKTPDLAEDEYPDYKVEVKNIGSISLLQKVFEYELERQSDILSRGEKPTQETRGTRDMTGKTYSQRIKEEADDYRYFPEPDIPPLEFDKEYIEEIRATLPLLPDELLQKLLEGGVAREAAEIIIADEEKAGYAKLLLARNEEERKYLPELAKFIIGELTVLQEEEGTPWLEIADPKVLIEIAKLQRDGKVNSNVVVTLLQETVGGSLSNVSDIETYLKNNNLLKNTDSSAIEKIAREAIAKEPDAKERFQKNPNVAMYFVGQIMKEMKGSADPQIAKRVVEEILAS